ncbi:RNA 2',3'-cyclic phosphodiesterase [Aquibacillus rhizosphaerae]|uniref:RNA 2',3'-cyclic phosphodiesterase n=1 Tax=Aquibacillus rhizosphaerae TaxID=3051431 RepID=A0ABT7L0M9_9BACI|nr:RNA 2',3'-cyclic phosphodiesterase [Aquibacillus sp. LR5S19]MDL4839396.1 RNA 2',3'-cyclic phosphodiesterase [Aquibacillus sp. LR5S19]
MLQNMHYFIAIPLSQDIKLWLSDIQNNLKSDKTLGYKSWTHQDDLHITLKFLGSVSTGTIDKLMEHLEKINTISQFPLTIGGIGTFGNPNQPRVLWSGVSDSNSINSLYDAVEGICVALGFKEEKRPYRPHVTLAKKWSGQCIDIDSFQDDTFLEMKNFIVKHIVVYQIHPSDSPKYKVVKQIDLNRGE